MAFIMFAGLTDARSGCIFSVYASSVNQAGLLFGSQLLIATSLSRFVCERWACAVTLTVAMRPAADAIVTCSIANVIWHVRQYRFPAKTEIPQIRQTHSGRGGRFGGGKGDFPFASRWCRPVSGVEIPMFRLESVPIVASA